MTFKQSDCARMFGNPSSEGWGARNVVRISVPWKMHMDEIPIASIKINKVAAQSLRTVLDEIWVAAEHNQDKIDKMGMDVFSGDWSIRQARGLRMMSMHAYALAVDFNAPLNWLGKSESNTLFKPESTPVRIFKKHGWTWGGDWTKRRDAMHFQYPRVA